MSNSATCVIRNESVVPAEEEDEMATMLKEFTWPLKMSMVINMETKEQMEATLRMDGTVFDHELQKSWPTALQYIRHYTDVSVTAKDAMRLLAIDSGCLGNSTLWQIRERHPGFLQDAGLTPDQIAFRECVSALPVPMNFIVIDEDKKEHTVTLRENHLFSTKEDEGLSALEVCWIFKGWALDSDLAGDAMTVLYYTDADDGTEWSLSEILALSPFLQKCFPNKPTDDEIEDEIARYIQAIKTHTDQAGAAVIAQDFMNFLHDGCEEFMTWHPAFRLIALDKCDEFIEIYPEYPDLVAACKRLTTLWERFR
jgi:hypothetical protein